MRKTILLTASLLGWISANAELSQENFFDNNYTQEWGRLKLVGNQLSSEKGEAIQLKGWSTFSINYDEVVNCLTEDGFKAMKAWGANVVRLACYPQNSKGKYTEANDNKVQNLIELASKLNMYVLLDWHVLEGDLGDGDPNVYLNDAKGFFERHTKWCKQNGYNNVLYEICNEPKKLNGEDHAKDWQDIKDYANQILPIIESGDPGAMVVIGTPQWDQWPDDAAHSPIDNTKYNLGLLYACHVYACTHMGTVDSRMKTAAMKVPIFVSEWGSVSANGDGTICDKASTQFLGELEKEGNLGGQLISWCYWAWGQKDEASNCIVNCSQPYTEENLRPSGKFIVPILANGDFPTPPQSEYYAIQSIPMTGKDYGILNVGWWDKGEEGIAYHDNNSSMYVDPKTKEEVKEGADAKGTEAECCNMGAIYSGIADLSTCFRYGTCLDVSHSTAGLDADWGATGDGYGTSGTDLHNLCMTEPGEWAIYTIDVKKAGYYTVHCLTNSGTSSKGTIGLSIIKGKNAKQNGNIIRSWDEHNDEAAMKEEPWESFQLTATKKCGMYADGTQSEKGSTQGDPSKSYTCWGWTACGGVDSDDLTVLFKYEGQQKLLLSVSPDVNDTPGDFSNFLFTFKSDDIPEWEYEYDGVENYDAAMTAVTIYPNPAENEFTVTTDGAASVSIYNAAGAMVYNQQVDGDVVIGNNIPTGIYTVRVANNKGVKSMKLVVK
ncbi:MAG: cellulase family glycosylhydrolase [Paludibacteraceae bacterium]|nr:cellulase family glycosylhydrolase [Paludibacteraceae bacterium]